MTKLKILLACEQPLPSTKRAGRPNYTLKYLSRWGHDITVICPKPTESPNSAELIDNRVQTNVQYEYLPVRFEQFSILNRFKIMRSMTKEIRRAILDNAYDVIRTNGLIPSYASVCRSDLKIPTYGEITDVLTDQYAQFDLRFGKLVSTFANRIQERVARDITLASVETPIGRSRWVNLGLKREKIVVNPNGVDTNHFSSMGYNDNLLLKGLGFGDYSDLIFLVWHGDISKDDGLECLLKAMSILPRNFVLIIIGTGPLGYVRFLKNMVISLGLGDRVVFTGWIDYSKLPRYLDLSDIAVAPVLPTTLMNQANFFTKVREYIAMTKNIVATETAGLKSMLGDSVITFVSNPFDIEDLASKIEKAQASGIDAIKRARMKEIAEKIDWENIVKRDEEIMIGVAENRVRDASTYDLKL